ncbi:MAG: T9SS type A sorting domain-containing protein [Bacteroidales bacterium]|nr:T9SS type A sorting domain-containing protein [Bacteroidales bacterium]
MNHRVGIMLLFLSFSLFGNPQENVDIQVRTTQNTLAFPWAGGLNACQFGRIDLDSDGRKDLIAFDRHGNRLLCFLNRGGRGEINYVFAPEYAKFFPKLTDWAIFADYDGDGREDIFTYSKGWAGMKVYRNISTEYVDFELVVFPYLTSWQGGGEVNLIATNADYPAIYDIDGDGDLDILTFGVLGTFIEKHQNQSMERYGCRDSLVFEKTDHCWGRVAESEEDNTMFLDTCLFGKSLIVNGKSFRHRGATFAVRDLTGNGLPDLLLADVDYPSLTFLKNGGTPENALMVSQQTQFPENEPIRLASMPVPFFTDIDNDGIDDLLVSPFDPNPMACEGKESVWLYLNRGTNENPDFQLYTKSFLQNEMIDVGKGAYPAFTDCDGDGLTDLTVRDFYGQTTVFKNIGTTQYPVFEQIETVPSIDSSWSARCYFDVDCDGTLDLVEGNIEGRLSFYKGQGNDFGLVSDFWGAVDVRDYSSSYFGYSVPSLFYYRNDLLLCVGSEQGKLFLYRVSDDVVFEEVSFLWQEICLGMPESFGMHSAGAVADLNGDGVLEVVVGNFSGGLQLFNSNIAVSQGVEEEFAGLFSVYPNPSEGCFTVEGTGVLRITDVLGRVIMEKEIIDSEKVALPKGLYFVTLDGKTRKIVVD